MGFFDKDKKDGLWPVEVPPPVLDEAGPVVEAAPALPEGPQLREEKHIVDDLYRKYVKDKNGERIGPVDNVYVDDVYGQPEWISIKVGFLGTKSVYLPISALKDLTEDEMVAPWDKDVVMDSPTFKAEGGLSKDEEKTLFEYYNIEYVATPDGKELLDVEIVAAEESGTVNAPDDEFITDDGSEPVFSVVQEEMEEERREQVMENTTTPLVDVEVDRPAVGAAERDEVRDEMIMTEQSDGSSSKVAVEERAGSSMVDAVPPAFGARETTIVEDVQSSAFTSRGEEYTPRHASTVATDELTLKEQNEADGYSPKHLSREDGSR